MVIGNECNLQQVKEVQKCKRSLACEAINVAVNALLALRALLNHSCLLRFESGGELLLNMTQLFE